MKKLVIICLSFMIGTSNLYATQSEDIFNSLNNNIKKHVSVIEKLNEDEKKVKIKKEFIPLLEKTKQEAMDFRFLWKTLQHKEWLKITQICAEYKSCAHGKLGETQEELESTKEAVRANWGFLNHYGHMPLVPVEVWIDNTRLGQFKHLL